MLPVSSALSSARRAVAVLIGGRDGFVYQAVQNQGVKGNVPGKEIEAGGGRRHLDGGIRIGDRVRVRLLERPAPSPLLQPGGGLFGHLRAGDKLLFVKVGEGDAAERRAVHIRRGIPLVKRRGEGAEGFTQRPGLSR